MAKHYVVADLHLGHANVLKYEYIRVHELSKWITYHYGPMNENEILEAVSSPDHPRFKQVVYWHNEMIIDAWNSVIKDEDIVFFLGDFCLTKNIERIKDWVSQLRGRKRMIMGNHDLRKEAFYMECGFESVCRWPVLYNRHIWLSHEPMPKELVPEGYINFFGHVHSNESFNWERGICVSVEQLMYFRPISIDKHIGDWSELYPNRHEQNFKEA